MTMTIYKAPTPAPIFSNDKDVIAESMAVWECSNSKAVDLNKKIESTMNNVWQAIVDFLNDNQIDVGELSFYPSRVGFGACYSNNHFRVENSKIIAVFSACDRNKKLALKLKKLGVIVYE